MSGVRSYREQDFYALLEVSHDASQAEIEAAYARLKSVFDSSSSATYMLFGDDEAGSMRQMLDEAYQTLSDEAERERYDSEIGVERAIDTRLRRDVRARSDDDTSTTSASKQVVRADEAPKSDIVRPPEAAPAVVAQEAPEEALIVTAMPVLTGPAPRDDENMEYSGGVLMRLRESKGVTLQAIAQRTKISQGHLRAIEANQYDRLPARVYVRGFVAQYAKFLGLNADRVCASYLGIYDRFVQAKTTP